MRSHPSNAAKRPKAKQVIDSIIIEPREGCVGCEWCNLAARKASPEQRKSMTIELAREGFRKLREQAAAEGKTIAPNAVVNLTGRGNPLDSEYIRDVIKVVREELPRSDIRMFWSLCDVHEKQELMDKIENAGPRTLGVNTLVLSADFHHLAMSGKQLKELGLLEKIPGRSFREKAENAMKERIKWAAEAAEKNGIKLKFRVTAPKFLFNRWLHPEHRSMRDLIKSALGTKRLYEYEDVDYATQTTRGEWLLEPGEENEKIILWDGSVVDKWPVTPKQEADIRAAIEKSRANKPKGWKRVWGDAKLLFQPRTKPRTA